MSYLLLEEASGSHDAKTGVAQAFLARSGGSGSGSSSTGSTAGGGSSGGSAGTLVGATGRSGGIRPKNKKKGRESNFPGVPRGVAAVINPPPIPPCHGPRGITLGLGLCRPGPCLFGPLALGCSAHGLPSNPNKP
jgi:hypothetical protein